MCANLAKNWRMARMETKKVQRDGNVSHERMGLDSNSYKLFYPFR